MTSVRRVPEPAADPPPPGAPWTILRMILWSAAYLEDRGVERGRLDAEYLLADVLGTDRLQLYLEHERPLAPEEIAAYKPLLLRRARREPLQHVLGHTSFRELELVVDARALVPRPETEVLVQVVIDWARPASDRLARPLVAADVGTGGGCIALSLALEGPFDRVVATDVSTGALELARVNVERTGLSDRVELRRGDLLEALSGERFDCLVSNPPYVSAAERSSLAAEVADFEPAQALFAGDDGTALLSRLAVGAPAFVEPGGLLALEVGLGQARGVAGELERSGAWHRVRVHDDLTGRPRIVTGERRGGGQA